MAYRFIVTASAAALLICSTAFAAPKLTAERYPVIAASVPAMRDALIAGAVDGGGQVRIATTALRYPVHRSGLLVGQDLNSANASLTAIIDKRTGAVRLTVLLIDRLRRKEATFSDASLFLGEQRRTVLLRQTDRTSVTEPTRWTRSCNKFTGCMPVLTGGGTQWTTTYEAELPLDLFRQLAVADASTDAHLAFWIGDNPAKASKQARDTDDPQLLLFNRQAQALSEAISAKGGRI